MTQSLTVDLHINAADFLQHYQGSVRTVSCRSRDGRTVLFPTRILQRFVGHNGVHGTFRMEIDENHKLVSVRQIA
jgi:hypothetical protein